MNLQKPFLPYWVCGATSYVELPVLGLPLVCSKEVGTESVALRVAMRCPSPGKKLCQEKLFLQGSCQRDFYSPSCCGKGEVLDMPCLCLSVAAITGVVYPVSRWHTLPFWPAGSCLEQCYPDVQPPFHFSKVQGQLMFCCLPMHASAQGFSVGR